MCVTVYGLNIYRTILLKKKFTYIHRKKKIAPLSITFSVLCSNTTVYLEQILMKSEHRATVLGEQRHVQIFLSFSIFVTI